MYGHAQQSFRYTLSRVSAAAAEAATAVAAGIMLVVSIKCCSKTSAPSKMCLFFRSIFVTLKSSMIAVRSRQAFFKHVISDSGVMNEVTISGVVKIINSHSVKVICRCRRSFNVTIVLL